jgi:hypothetical protein
VNPLSSTSLSFTLLLDLFLRREEREREREEEKEDCCGVRNFISYVLCAASPSLLRDRRLFFARVLIFTGCRRGYWGYKAARVIRLQMQVKKNRGGGNPTLYFSHTREIMKT